MFIRHLRDATRAVTSFTDARPSTRPTGGCSAAQMKPASSRATATATFGAGLCSASIRRNRRHNRCCALSAIAITRAGWPLRRAVEGAPDARAMLVVPARFHQDPADQRVAHPGDAPAPMLLAAGVLARAPSPDRPSTPGPSRSGGSHAAPRGSASPSTCRCRGSSATTRRARDTAPVSAISASRASSSTSRASV